MKEKVKVAVIGCGTIANSAHIPAYMACDMAEIKYFCDIIPERADKAVEKYGCGKAIYDYHEILDDPELDAVSCAGLMVRIMTTMMETMARQFQMTISRSILMARMTVQTENNNLT